LFGTNLKNKLHQPTFRIGFKSQTLGLLEQLALSLHSSSNVAHSIFPSHLWKAARITETHENATLLMKMQRSFEKWKTHEMQH